MNTPVFANSRRHVCTACGSRKFSIYQSPGCKHTGASCAGCGHWLKWLNKREKEGLRLPQILPPSPTTCGERPQHSLFDKNGGVQ